MTKLFKKSLFALVLVLMLLFPFFGQFGTNIIANAVSGEVETLTIAVAHLNERVSDLETAIDTKADAETIDAKIAELEQAIIDAEIVVKAYADAQDETLKNELTAAIESAKSELAAAIQTKADAEAVNAKIAELEAAIIAAETAAKTYADTQDETLKNELTAAIESAKNELAGTGNTGINLDAINAKIAELEAAVIAVETAAKSYADAQDETLKNELTAAIDTAKSELAAAIAAKADAETINAKIAELDAAVAAMTKDWNGIKQKTEALETKNDEFQTVLIIVCVVSGVTFCCCGVFGVLFFIDRKKRLRE